MALVNIGQGLGSRTLVHGPDWAWGLGLVRILAQIRPGVSHVGAPKCKYGLGFRIWVPGNPLKNDIRVAQVGYVQPCEQKRHPWLQELIFETPRLNSKGGPNGNPPSGIMF